MAGAGELRLEVLVRLVTIAARVAVAVDPYYYPTMCQKAAVTAMG